MDRIAALRDVIHKTVSAIVESREQIEAIANSTMDEVRRLELEYEEVRDACNAAIAMVEKLEREARAARERLMVVNRDMKQYSEADMKVAYDAAQSVQVQLGQWREREMQLRFRRDDIARRLKALRATAHRAEVLVAKFNHTSQYLTAEFEDMATVLETAHIHQIVGLQMLQMQEEERRWLATRLHDGPMQNLATLGMRLQTGGIDGTANPQQEIRRRLNHVISELRQMVFDLRPPLLDDLGLVPTLKRYLQQWADTHEITARIHLVGLEAPLGPTEKVAVFRAIQEAVKNVAYHSDASQVDVTLTYTGDNLQVTVEDDGIGIVDIDWTKWLESGRMGLVLTRQRLRLIGGSLQVEASSPHGTKVVFTLPVRKGSD